MKTTSLFAFCLMAFSVAASTNGLGRVPPMGWNSWYCFVDAYDASTIRGIADAMATNGLKAAGYEYINLDDCFWHGRDAGGSMIVDTDLFPGGISNLAAYVHSKGFKFGTYANVSPWPSICRIDAPASYGHESNDVADFINRGVDFLKIDFLGAIAPGFPPGFTETAQEVATRWHDLLSVSTRPVMLSLSGGYFEGWKPDLANLFRISGDINVSWQGVTNNLALAHRSARLAGPGRWNDPDMIFIGVGNGLSDTEARSFFSLWCITAAPLILSSDVRSMTPATKAIVTAPELIAVNQDPLGTQGIRVSSIEAIGGNLEVWCKPLSAVNARAVALFNQSSNAANISVQWNQLLLQDGPAMVRDLWARAGLGMFTNSFTATVPSHGAVVLKITGTPLPPPIYLSDISNRTVTGTVSFDRSSELYYGFPVLSLDDILYPKGIGMEPPSSIRYDLSHFQGSVSRFVADIGLDKDTRGVGSATFQVWADGIKLLERGPVGPTNAAQTVWVDLRGRQNIELVTVGTGHADWADARILVWTQPQFTGIARQPAGTIRIGGVDAAGRTNLLLASTNLSSPGLWSAVATNTADTNGVITFPDQPTNQLRRFYRMRRQ